MKNFGDNKSELGENYFFSLMRLLQNKTKKKKMKRVVTKGIAMKV
jgi:hypothetical protein